MFNIMPGNPKKTLPGKPIEHISQLLYGTQLIYLQDMDIKGCFYVTGVFINRPVNLDERNRIHCVTIWFQPDDVSKDGTIFYNKIWFKIIQKQFRLK